MISTTVFNGLILTGGQSSRMGIDKARMNFHGKPQYEFLTHLLLTFCDDVYVSCKKDQYPDIKNTIADHFDLDSPLNGILSAFHFDPFASWITVAADMPNVNKAAIQYLIKNRNPHKLATCFFDSEGIDPEPLFTIWEHKSKPALFDFFNGGGFSAKKFLQENDVHIIACPNPNWLVNVNTQKDLQKYLKDKEAN